MMLWKKFNVNLIIMQQNIMAQRFLMIHIWSLKNLEGYELW